MEMIYSRELGMSLVPDEVSNANQTKLSFSDALALYQRLKGTGKSNLFFKVSNRSIRYLQECFGHNKIVNLKPADAGLLIYRHRTVPPPPVVLRVASPDSPGPAPAWHPTAW